MAAMLDGETIESFCRRTKFYCGVLGLELSYTRPISLCLEFTQALNNLSLGFYLALDISVCTCNV